MNNKRAILCGYHWAGCKALELLLEDGYEVYVYTHKSDNYIADLERLCVKRNIKYTLDKITIDNIPFIPNIICIIYYRYIIGQDIINAADGKIFSLHPSLPPKYCGCGSLTCAMTDGEKKCGFTYLYINVGCDIGNIILQREVVIEDFDTQLTLYSRVMFESMKDFMKAVELVLNKYTGIPQNEKSILYKRGCPLDGVITDLMEESMKERPIRAMCNPPYPAAKYQERERKTVRELNEDGGVTIFGCGGHARSLINTIYETNKSIKIVLVDENAQDNEIVMGCKVTRLHAMQGSGKYIVAIGDNQKRKKLFDAIKGRGKGKPISIISIHARISISAIVGDGTFVASNVYIGPEAYIGENTIINTASIIEHGAIIGDHVNICPNVTICGRAKIGNGVFCGAGSIVVDNINICDNVILGAGAVVKEDIAVAGTYVGVPVRKVS